jgi:hypothetical protein
VNAPAPGDGVLVGVAAVAAFVAGLFAVSNHAECTNAGYRLAVAKRENMELRREVDQAARRVSALRTPQAATARAASMKLASLKYPKTWNVASSSVVQRCALDAASSGVSAVPASAKGVVR